MQEVLDGWETADVEDLRKAARIFLIAWVESVRELQEHRATHRCARKGRGRTGM
jgi:hypothetical protein